jgi:hypothetical protein
MSCLSCCKESSVIDSDLGERIGCQLNWTVIWSTELDLRWNWDVASPRELS